MKIRELKICAILIAILFFNNKLFAQNNFSIHIGASIPILEFAADEVISEGGHAATGYTLGINYTYPISKHGFGIFGGIDLMYNSATKKYKTDLQNFITSNVNPDWKIFPSNYINIPITAGLSFKSNNNQKHWISFFGNFGLALNTLKQTDLIIQGANIVYSFDPSINLGYNLGVGIIMKEIYGLSINYYGAGIHEIKGKIYMNSVFDKDYTGENKVDIITLTFGIHF